MTRKPDTYVVARHLVGSKIWNGEVYHPENQDELPADFPQDGPWWNDYVPNEPVKKVRTISQVIPQDDEIEAERARLVAEQEDEYEKQNDVTKLPLPTKRGALDK